MNDIFQEVHSLLRNHAYEDALNALLNDKTGQIKKPFSKDLNHAWYLVGDILYKQDEIEDAIKAFEESYKNNAGDSEALWALSSCYFQLNNPERAEKHLRKALSIEPNSQNLKYNLGNALFDQREYRDALALYEEIEKNDEELYSMAQKNIAACKVNIEEIKKSRPG